MARRKTISRSASARRSKSKGEAVGNGWVHAQSRMASESAVALPSHESIRNCSRQSDDLGMRWLFSRLFSDHPAQICLLDMDGVIRMVNRAWCSFSQANGGDVSDDAYVGRNYLDVCQQSAESGDEHAQQALVALLEVMTTGRRSAVMTYPCHAPHEKRFYRLWIENQSPETPAIVVAHSLIRAEPVRLDAPVPWAGQSSRT
jgi:hypothetical protein